MSKKKTLKKILGKITDKVGSGIGAVMSIKSKYKGAMADIDRKAITGARAYGDAPKRNPDKSVSDAYKAKYMSDEVIKKRKKKVAKEAAKRAANK